MQQFANRSTLLIMPKEPFKEWVKFYNEKSLEDLRAHLNEKRIYLIEFAYREDLRDNLRPYYVEYFNTN